MVTKVIELITQADTLSLSKYLVNFSGNILLLSLNQ